MADESNGGEEPTEGSGGYKPPKGLPFKSTGSFEGDKQRYQENRDGYLLELAHFSEEGMESVARAKHKEYEKLNEFFGIEPNI